MSTRRELHRNHIGRNPMNRRILIELSCFRDGKAVASYIVSFRQGCVKGPDEGRLCYIGMVPAEYSSSITVL